MRTLLVLLDKEFRQFFRNPFLPKMAVMFPLMVMLVIPWVTTQDVRHVGVAVVDHDRTAASRRILQKIGASDYYTLYDVADSYASALGALEEGGIDVIVEIPDGFELQYDNTDLCTVSSVRSPRGRPGRSASRPTASTHSRGASGRSIWCRP